MTTNDFAPDVVYGLGGGGTELALQFLEQDWILDRIVRPRSSRPEDVTVRLLDTATEEMNRKQARIEDIRRRRDELKDRYHGEHDTRPGDVTIDPVLVSRNMNMMNATVLTGDQEVEAIAEANGMDPDDWWLERADVDENLNFAKGVHRQRGLAKATLYRAMASRNEVSSALETTRPCKVAIFVGLGGGSGSGMLFDVIRSLTESNPNNELVVFGVLPSSTEDSDGVHANAYATLCELEAMRLSETDPLEDVVLYHLDPSDYEGKEGNQLDADGLEEFDEAFCQSVVSYYAATGEEQFNRTYSFAPFTVAVPQVISYNVEAIDEARSAMETRLEARCEAAEIERQVVDELRELYRELGVADLATVEADPDVGNIPDESIEALRERLEELHGLATEELFDELEYASAARFVDAYESALGDVDEGDPVALARRLKNYTGSIEARHDARDDLDELLGETLASGVRRVAEQAELLVRRQAIDQTQLKSAVGDFVPLRRGMRRDLSATRANLDVERRERTVRRHEQTVEQLQKELRAHRESQSDAVEEAMDRWTSETVTAREELAAHDVAEAKTLLSALREALHEHSVAVESAETTDELKHVSDAEVTTALNELADYEDRVRVGAFSDFTLVDRNTVREACAKLVDARKTSLNATGSDGLLDRLTSFGRSKHADIDATRRLRDLHEELEQTDIFSIKPATEEFGVSVVFDVDGRAERVAARVEELQAEIVRCAQVVVPESDGGTVEAAGDGQPTLVDEQVNRIRTAVKNGTEPVSVAERVFEEVLTDDGGLQEELTEAKEKLGSARLTRDAYRATDSLFDSLLGGPYADYIACRDRAAEAAEEYQSIGTSFGTEDGFDFRCTLRPQNLMATARKSGLSEANLFDSRAERQTFEGGLEDVIENVHDAEYHGLAHRQLTGTNANYYGTDVNIGLVAPIRGELVETSSKIADRIDQGFAVSSPGSVTDSVGVFQVEDERGTPIGADWDVGVHTFISGVFLDNLRVVSSRNFREEYEELSTGTSPKLHHAYQLEEGKLVRRTEHINLESLAERDFYLRGSHAEDEVREEILTTLFDTELEADAESGSDGDTDTELADEDADTVSITTDGGGDESADTGRSNETGDARTGPTLDESHDAY
ncbi:tubulin-like doman-containing protein [Natronorubrum sp. A-ect3]|uniref:tubulin-like doman-containing protein n=1 Tax=Natronorubrum sp. A-ect3 TaxID=3242698 RepID=UPI00359D5716